MISFIIKFSSSSFKRTLEFKIASNLARYGTILKLHYILHEV